MACVAIGMLSSAGANAQGLFDVFFLTDTTGSMGSLISGVQTSSTTILDRIAGSADVRFGVGEYKDGNADAFGVRFNLSEAGVPILSADRTAVVGAIDGWGASGGGDFPEDNLYGLRETAATVPWREGSRRIIFWFGDAPSLDPGSDGTTLASAIEALNAACIEVIAVDLRSLDSTGQATAVTDGMRDCGGGVLIDAGEVLDLDLSGLTPEEVAAAVEELIADAFGERAGISGDESIRLMLGSTRVATITAARTVTRDVGGRLARLRSGIRSEPVVTTMPAPVDSKGGMAKGGMSKEAVTMTTTRPWEVYGQVFYSTEDQDGQNSWIGAGTAAPRQIVTQADTTTDVFGGTVGVEYDFNQNWSAGFAISGARTDVDVELVGTSDIDTLALIPYVSYYRPIGEMGFYADLLYAYGMNDYDIARNNGAMGSPDGDFNALEFNLGLNIRSGSVVHGPFAQLRWLDGTIDGYQELGGGGAIIPDSDYESLPLQLGYQVSYPMAMGSGTLVPQGSVAWEHEFEADQGNIAGIPSGVLDEDVAVLAGGVNYYMTSGWNFGLVYEVRLGSESTGQYVGLKAGMEF